MNESHLARVAAAAATFGRGEVVLVLDEEGPGAIGMLILSAEHADPEPLHQLGRVARGGQYLALTAERCEQLGLDLVASYDDDIVHAPVTTPIAAREGVSHGVGVAERARTISVAIDPSSSPRDIRYGGHVLPLRARDGGVLERAGFTEAAIDLAKIAGAAPAAVLAEVINDDGSATEGAQYDELARRRELPTVTIGELIADRRRHERLVDRIVATTIATRGGPYQAVGYRARFDDTEHVAMVRGEVAGAEDVPVYVHLSCWEGDVFRSYACDCRARLDAAEAVIAREGRGVIVHLANPAYFRHQERTYDEAVRDFGIAAHILSDLALTTLRVLADRARPLPGLEGYDLTISAYENLFET